MTAPTCTEAGFTTYTCSVCGGSYVADETAATGHTYSDEWKKDTTTHWKECVICHTHADEGTHVDDNHNHICDTCSYVISTCDQSQATPVYTHVPSTNTHTVIYMCVVCNKPVGEAATENCTDENEDGKCDKCEGAVEIVPSGTTVTGTVKAYNKNYAPVVKLYVDGVEKYTVTPDEATASGSQYIWTFTFEGVAEGEYDLVVTKEAHLTYTVTGVDVNGETVDLNTHTNTAVSMMNMLCGALDNDSMINNMDLYILLDILNYGMPSADAQNEKTDLNGDGLVNNMDLYILLDVVNYGMTERNCTFIY